MSGEFYVGLMSGTSLDGVDAVLVELGKDGIPNCLATHFLPYADVLRGELLDLHTPGTDELHRASVLANRLTDLYAQATNELLVKAGTAATAVSALGCHGQTVRHAPAAGYTIQLCNPARLAEQTGITVVADFRSRDIAAGGQGAPLVPAFHDALFRAPDRHRVILNIGGIANLTDLASERVTTGFDCGPGNMLLDAWARRHLDVTFDAGGQWAQEGRPDSSLLARLYAHPYFAASPPKSCGREEFGIVWLDRQLAGNELPADVQATLVQLTARAAIDAFDHWCGRPAELFVCGGGAHNTAIMQALADGLDETMVATTDALGLPADWVEAVAFAWLAYRSLHRLPGNLSTVTGARGARILGAIYPA